MDGLVFFPVLVPLVAEAWVAMPVDSDNPLLTGVLREAFPHVRQHPLVVTHESLATATGDGRPAWGGHEVRVEPVAEVPDPQLAGAAARVVVTELLPGHVDPAPRICALMNVVSVLESALMPIGWRFPHSGCVLAASASEDAIQGGVVRLRREPSTVRPGGWLLSTLGMVELGLPDVECHVHGVDVHAVAERVVALADGMVAGEFIGDGDPVIVGRVESDRYEYWFTARYAMSVSQPPRRVIMLVPEPDHAVDPPPPDVPEQP